MRPRDPSRLASTSYDVVVIGGGIVGLACAYEAATRGLTTALLEAGDFGGEASFNHQKTAHGGLRALQTLSFIMAREGIRERRALARIAPWLLRPLPFVVGTYRSVRRGRAALRAAFALDAWLGRDRNAGIEPELHLPAARLLSRTTTLKLFPGIRREGLTGGAQWYDYQMTENDRLTFAFAAAADRAGADLANYVEAREVVRESRSVAGVRALDLLTGADVNVQGRMVVNAAGARAGEVMRMLGVPRPFPLVKAVNLVTARPAGDIALAAPGPSGRMLTLVPWRGRAIAGTFQSSTAVSTADARITQRELDSAVFEANDAFPALQLTTADVTLVHRGLVPARVRRDGNADLLPASQIFDHAVEGLAGAVTLVGAKYTTARGLAERAVDLLGRKMRRRLAPSRTAVTVLPFAGIADHEALAIETARRFGVALQPPLLRHLIGRYAEGAAEIVKLIANQPEALEPVVTTAPAILAEVLYTIRHEGAVRLSDIVLRRTSLGAAGHPGVPALAACARIAAAELGWSEERTREEQTAVEEVYRVEQV